MPCQVAPALMKRVLDYFDAVKIGLTAPLHADMVNRLLDKAFQKGRKTHAKLYRRSIERI